jgi:hypothetical protein
MLKVICDECGADGAGHVLLDLSRSDPLIIPADQPYELDRDLCQKCFDRLLAKVCPILRMSD